MARGKAIGRGGQRRKPPVEGEAELLAAVTATSKELRRLEAEQSRLVRERNLKALEVYERGGTMAVIARMLGVARSRAGQMVKAGRAAKAESE